MLAPTDFFTLEDKLAIDIFGELFSQCDYVWEILPRIQAILAPWIGDSHTVLGKVSPYAVLGDAPIFIEKGAIVEAHTFIEGPAYISAGSIVRQGAYIRPNVILFRDAILGHCSEAKNAIFFPGAHAPHFNYVGDSILGHGVNLGAGTKLSNLSMMSKKDSETGQRPTIKIKVENVVYDTGMTKMGAILGDRAQTGCNAVLNPGCILGRDVAVYANVSLRKGYYRPNQIIKLRQNIEYAESE